VQRLSFRAAVLAFILVGLVMACDDPVSKNPTSPTVPSVVGIQINGPDTVAPGQSAQFSAELRLSDGAVKSTSAATVRWRTSSPSIQVSQSGLVTASSNGGEATLTAEAIPQTTIRATKSLVFVPDGTFRVTGVVRDADPPAPGIAGARVEVSGTSVATTTDGGGNYRLYGVPPSAEIQVTAAGYRTVTQSVQLTTHTTQNFSVVLASPRLSLNGSFLVMVDVVGSCLGTPALLDELKHRTYEANATTSGAVVNIQLTEPRFKVTNGLGSSFSGRADATSIRFTLNDDYYQLPSVVERLSSGAHLVPYGSATTTPANGGVSGVMSGGVINYDSRYPSFYLSLGNCFFTSTGGMRLTLTPR
jgi:hypothetical protein